MRIRFCNFYLVPVTLCLAVSAQAQYALFSKDTDTISIAGNTTLGSAATYEAVIRLTSTDKGNIFDEWQFAAEDKLLEAGSTGLTAFAFPVGNPVPITATFSTLTDTFHHIAYVYDGSQERLYLDGTMRASHTIAGNIGNSGSSIAAVGAIYRAADGAGAFRRSFQGYIDTLRISDVARYTGSSFVAPTGDLSTDANTQILYNFNELPGSTTVADLSGHGHTGTLGIGFTGATSPRLVPAPSALFTALFGVVPGVGLLWRRRKSGK